MICADDKHMFRPILHPRIVTIAGALILGSLVSTVSVDAAFAAPRPVAGATSYVVKDGDYLFGIAIKHKVKFGDLLEANGLSVTSVIHPGDTLVVPSKGASAGATPVASTPPVPSKADAVVTFALAQAGKPYKFAAAGPDAFDCSGLVTAAYKQVGVKLPQYSVLQATFGQAVDWTAQPIVAGDLVFLADPFTGVINHVGIAVSSTQWIQAVRAGDVVRVGKMPAAAKIAAVRRIIPA